MEALQRQVHTWVAYTDRVSENVLKSRYFQLLDNLEREQYGRLRFAADRHTYLAAHALRRVALSMYLRRSPGDWIFVSRPGGKPEISPAMAAPPLHFNLSHTDGAVAFSVTLSRECGVDVQVMRSLNNLNDMATQILSDDEMAQLETCRDAARLQKFYEFWVLKEAYVKAKGAGFAIALKGVAFGVEGKAVTVRFAPECADDPANWTFYLRGLTPRHKLAVAVQGESSFGDAVCREFLL